MLPSTGERAFVQVKSETSQSELNSYIEKIHARSETRMFYIFHSASSALQTSHEKCAVMGPNRLAHMVLDAGLYDWLIEKAD